MVDPSPPAQAQPPQWPTLSPLKTGLACRCPRCGQGALFKGFITVRPACPECGLDYSFADPADGPAFFVMSGVGIAVTLMFLWMEIALRPPMWVHFIFTLPLFVVGCLATLRPVKAWLVSEQFVRKASEAEFSFLGRSGPKQPDA
ncbi:DUF983 domain-containing protein [Brevundimonas sp.]|uniref:DUF983 domain-containing protein n=1 Tax=Brevundimonas sp. TaxID=1871086 RepID=UPI00391C6A49